MRRGRPRIFDKTAALDSALRLFWQHGYEGTSIAMLSEGIGINAASLYAAFGNKEQLFLAAVARYSDLNGKLYDDALNKKTARDVTRTVLEGEVELVTRRGHPSGCLIVQGALVTSPESEKIRRAVAAIRRAAEKLLAKRYQRAIEEGDLPPETDASTIACYVMTLASGLAVQAKSGSKKADLKKVVSIAMENLPYMSS